MNHVATKQEEDTISVSIEKFDDLIDLKVPTLVKIDVEGFETEVFNGMSAFLANPNLKAIIVELNGSGKRYGYCEDKIHSKLTVAGFTTYLYHPFERKLEEVTKFGSHNTIYIKDFSFVNSRVENAQKIKINKKEF